MAAELWQMVFSAKDTAARSLHNAVLCREEEVKTRDVSHCWEALNWHHRIAES